MPPMVMLVALAVVQVKVAGWPGSMADGLTLMLAVGAGGGGGGGDGGGGATTFLWQPARTTIARQSAAGSFFSLESFTVNLLFLVIRR
jgi:hypothetical protein